ncbi:C-type lectin domain family 4 member G-like isoform X4 [Leguminivora glycinivorella]|uniref:C-type lectin domain family 4 member G-like isoform X4 n=1 Tax=Leguminivora glycinivorella TaxID=1035111 RepID=UPI00200E60AD|nr:C-type lectin domain family 4 member G-like isoform X4 [Leguminivora glycinivorella]
MFFLPVIPSCLISHGKECSDNARKKRVGYAESESWFHKMSNDTFTGLYYAARADADFVYSSEAGGLVLHTLPGIWSDAAMRCYLEGGMLASPTSSGLVREMTANMAEHKLTRVFTGINSILYQKSFKSLDGYKWEERTKSCYKYHETGETWRQALATCHADGGHLAIINTQTESTVLKEMFNEKGGLHAFVGFSHYYDDEWATIHGETLSGAGFSKWGKDEPNNTGKNEFCGSINQEGLLNDASCNVPAPFICEFIPKK